MHLKRASLYQDLPWLQRKLIDIIMVNTTMFVPLPSLLLCQITRIPVLSVFQTTGWCHCFPISIAVPPYTPYYIIVPASMCASMFSPAQSFSPLLIHNQSRLVSFSFMPFSFHSLSVPLHSFQPTCSHLFHLGTADKLWRRSILTLCIAFLLI